MNDYWRDHRENRKRFRRSLEPCPQCQTKNPPEDEKCRRCGGRNPNFVKRQDRKEIER